jgi:hypothetical protein
MQSGWRVEIFGTVEGLQKKSPASGGDLNEEFQEVLAVGAEWEDRRLSPDTPVALVKTVSNYKGIGRLVWFGLYWSAQEKGVTRPGGYMGAGLWLLNCSFDIRHAMATLVELKNYVAAHAMVDNRFFRNLSDLGDIPPPPTAPQLVSSIREEKKGGAMSEVFSKASRDVCPVLLADPLEESTLPLMEWAVSDGPCELYKRIVVGRAENVGALQISGFSMVYHSDLGRFLNQEYASLVNKLKNAEWKLLNQEESENEYKRQIQSLKNEKYEEKIALQGEITKKVDTLREKEEKISRLEDDIRALESTLARRSTKKLQSKDGGAPDGTREAVREDRRRIDWVNVMLAVIAVIILLWLLVTGGIRLFKDPPNSVKTWFSSSAGVTPINSPKPEEYTLPENSWDKTPDSPRALDGASSGASHMPQN